MNTMKIVTKPTVRNQGAENKIVAKGGGKQRTITFDPSVSDDRNHGIAAGTLALALGLQDGDIVHTVDGTVHTFTWE